jgi:anti-sigma factor RsiW
MNCREAEHHIFAERDGTLENNQRAALAAHVGTCSACRQFQVNLGKAVDTLRASTQQVRVPDAELEWQKLRREIRGGATASTTTQRRSSLAWFALPLATAAALALAFFINPRAPNSGSSSSPNPTVAQVDPTATSESESASTVVFVDDKSGWTFVWASNDGTQHI